MAYEVKKNSPTWGTEFLDTNSGSCVLSPPIKLGPSWVAGQSFFNFLIRFFVVVVVCFFLGGGGGGIFFFWCLVYLVFR